MKVAASSVYCLKQVHLSMSFGASLKRIRESKGLSQHQLAYKYGFVQGKEFGATGSQIAHWEKDRRHPSRETVNLLCNALGASPDECNELMMSAGYMPESEADPLDGIKNILFRTNTPGPLSDKDKARILEVIEDIKKEMEGESAE